MTYAESIQTMIKFYFFRSVVTFTNLQITEGTPTWFAQNEMMHPAGQNNVTIVNCIIGPATAVLLWSVDPTVMVLANSVIDLEGNYVGLFYVENFYQGTCGCSTCQSSALVENNTIYGDSSKVHTNTYVYYSYGPFIMRNNTWYNYSLYDVATVVNFYSNGRLFCVTQNDISYMLFENNVFNGSAPGGL